MHATCFSAFLAFAAPPAGSQSGQGPAPGLFGSPIIFLVLVGLMMYFMVFRPQQQRAKNQAKMLSALKVNDKVVTSSGLIGTVATVKETTVMLRCGDAKIEVTKSSITDLVPDNAGSSTAS
jgi:preprotein translocase subunit YajC